MATRAAKYKRISDDREGRELGIDRQDADLDEHGARRGLTFVASYVDNDRGASTRSRKPRPDYARMLKDARAGAFEVICAYTSSRLTRRPREHEDLIELAETRGIRYEFVRSPSFDLNTSAGRRVARILAANDAGEAEDIAERVAARRLQQAQRGEYGGGRRPFGWEKDGRTPRPDEIEALAWGIWAVLDGVPIREQVRLLATRGVTRDGGKPLTPTTWRRLLVRPRNAGLVVYQGDILEGVEGAWGAAVDPETWWAAVAVLEHPSRNTNPGRAPAWLGTSIYLCGHPDCIDDDSRTLRVTTMRGGRRYTCRWKAHIGRDAVQLDRWVEHVVVARLSRPDARALVRTRPDVDAVALNREAALLRTRIEEALDMWESGEMTRAQYKERSSSLQARISAIEQQLAAASYDDPLSDIAGKADAAKRWKGYSLTRKREILRAVATVTVLPAPLGRLPFNPDYVRIEPLHADAQT